MVAHVSPVSLLHVVLSVALPFSAVITLQMQHSVLAETPFDTTLAAAVAQ